MNIDQEQKEQKNRNVEELIQVINNRFNQYLDQKEEEEQRNPIERVIYEFRVEKQKNGRNNNMKN